MVSRLATSLLRPIRELIRRNPPQRRGGSSGAVAGFTQNTPVDSPSNFRDTSRRRVGVGTSIAVSSSHLRSITYDDRALVLSIRFHNGRRYSYVGVPRRTFLGLVGATSKGTYFWAHIRNIFPTGGGVAIRAAVAAAGVRGASQNARRGISRR